MTTHDRFLQWVNEQGSKADAARALGVKPPGMHHLIANPGRRPGLDFAFAIERATDGAIRAREWAVLPPLQCRECGQEVPADDAGAPAQGWTPSRALEDAA